ncbi:hypothetical protein ACLIKE_08460 [Ferroplasma acidiphilum]|jgi:hypothetical protein|uniref:Uncharacterized protein n=1 Tax=Ferroplasma acidiphilum TaxID=74969 RepID=A0A1V0N243_9ARCH|nr:hypothetical protein [Ferroplasma acidiphilum]ARD84164.1 hypothetical protein FAD_0240 [Ferroplasma acidiphilum]NOL60995.1 hypothetical protein [Ferroplasma acidiphilum]
MSGLKEVPSFKTLSRRVRIIDLHSSNKDYYTAIGLKAITYNLTVIPNSELGEKLMEIMKIVIC